ncbi:hypothetical protein B7O87_08925 [Cylindrospermopsis raciborskii CENA303]|uniref:DUF3084 domain-containing protein n=1 Tax=Cylindrospermopsis raciborskii CENA303 TaxID=1170769 RepID=A0A1X4G7A1_9CYAN|nr:DUF3084 domain-containing protein [Cylindrospermopsis raciborskii]OSO90916.1 hypothetical protein B7O87_08925 [Cylindrospermopsis raciborskii CENA303]
MATGYILIAAILILGGVIATLGDRIGTKVGKARLSLFNLRPKKTAVVVTIFTGSVISATTLAILFAADEGLRKGVFELEDIQKDLRNKREQLKVAEDQRINIENRLIAARKAQEEAKDKLIQTNKSLQEANSKQKSTQAKLDITNTKQIKTQTQLRGTQSKLGKVVIQYRQALGELENLYQQRQALQLAVGELRSERQQLYAQAQQAIDEAKNAVTKRDRELFNRKAIIAQRDRKIAGLDRLIQNRNLEIRKREQIIASREVQLGELEKQQQYLEQEVARLEKYYQSYRDLRLGKLALVRGQVIASAVVSVKKPNVANQVISQIFQEANNNASTQLNEPGTNQNNTDLLRISEERVEQLTKQIQDGREYVVRIFSAGNYVRGEKQIEFFADAMPNQLVFSAGQVLATTSADMKSMTSYQLRQRLDLVISASQFRARNAGIVERIEIDGTFLRFFSELEQSQQPLEVKAVAAENIYTAGPLRVRLVAISNGKTVFST